MKPPNRWIISSMIIIINIFSLHFTELYQKIFLIQPDNFIKHNFVCLTLNSWASLIDVSLEVPNLNVSSQSDKVGTLRFTRLLFTRIMSLEFLEVFVMGSKIELLI